MARTPKVVDDRREQIIAAAMRVFSQKGFDRATNKDIALEAEITPGLIYHYFASKEELLKAAIESYPQRQILRSLPENMPEQSAEQLLRSVAQQLLEVAEDERLVRILRIVLPEMIHNPTISPSGSSTVQQLVKFVEEQLASKMESGELRRADAGLVAQLFVSSLLDMVLRRQVFGDPSVKGYTHAQIVDAIVTLTLQGLEPRQASQFSGTG